MLVLRGWVEGDKLQRGRTNKDTERSNRYGKKRMEREEQVQMINDRLAMLVELKVSLVEENGQLDAMMKLGAEMAKNTEDEQVIGELALMKMQRTIFTEMFNLFSKYFDIYKESTWDKLKIRG